MQSWPPVACVLALAQTKIPALPRMTVTPFLCEAGHTVKILVTERSNAPTAKPANDSASSSATLRPGRRV